MREWGESPKTSSVCWGLITLPFSGGLCQFVGRFGGSLSRSLGGGSTQAQQRLLGTQPQRGREKGGGAQSYEPFPRSSPVPAAARSSPKPSFVRQKKSTWERDLALSFERLWFLSLLLSLPFLYLGISLADPRLRSFVPWLLLVSEFFPYSLASPISSLELGGSRDDRSARPCALFFTLFSFPCAIKSGLHYYSRGLRSLG